MKNILAKLLKIQQELKVPKNQQNKFGNYSYRSCEDILEKARPICTDNGAVLILNDEINHIDSRYYISATAILYDVESGEKIEVSAHAREADEKKGMDVSQITGASSSYARKYALCGLFCLDDNKDADTMDNTTTNTNSKNERQKLLSSICQKISSNKIDNQIITKILETKYQKYNSNQLNISELADLDKNILKYSKEF